MLCEITIYVIFVKFETLVTFFVMFLLKHLMNVMLYDICYFCYIWDTCYISSHTQLWLLVEVLVVRQTCDIRKLFASTLLFSVKFEILVTLSVKFLGVFTPSVMITCWSFCYPSNLRYSLFLVSTKLLCFC